MREAPVAYQRPPMTQQAIETAGAPRAIGPYSQAIHAGELLFLSGQIPLDPATGELVSGGIEEQTRRVLDNLGAVLTAAGCSFGNVVKTTIYLIDLADFAVNAVYASYFRRPPARAPRYRWQPCPGAPASRSRRSRGSDHGNRRRCDDERYLGPEPGLRRQDPRNHRRSGAAMPRPGRQPRARADRRLDAGEQCGRPE